MTIVIDGGAGVTFPDTVQQTNAVTNTGGVPRYYAARAWVVFDGSTTPPSILASVNVASVSRSATGSFTINFTSNMPNANYSLIGTALGSTSGTAKAVLVNLLAAPAVGSASIRVTSIDAAAVSAETAAFNSTRISVAVFA